MPYEFVITTPTTIEIPTLAPTTGSKSWELHLSKKANMQPLLLIRPERLVIGTNSVFVEITQEELVAYGNSYFQLVATKNRHQSIWQDGYFRLPDGVLLPGGVGEKGDKGDPGAPGEPGITTVVGGVSQGLMQETITEAVQTHVEGSTPHPAYDDIPSLTLLFENGLV
jgi:hypothetical protein